MDESEKFMEMELKKMNNIKKEEPETKTKYTDKILSDNFRVIKRLFAIFVIWNVLISIILLAIVL